MNFGSHDLKLVGLSLAVAIFSSWMALQIAGQAGENRAQRLIVLGSGSLALGAGVWAMHFIGMLAFDLCTAVDYDPGTTILSSLPSIAASFVALSLIARERLGGWTLLAGGVLVGAGIGAMHYAGMAGMQTGLALHYDPLMFALSIVVAVVLATLALWVRFGLSQVGSLGPSQRLFIAALVMGCAIAGMHYTGMAAARFAGTAAPRAAGASNGSFLALAISLITTAFTIFVVAANGFLRYRQMYHELSRNEAWMRTLLSTAVDGAITIGSDGTIREFNAAAERIFGWRREEILGRNVRELIAGQDRPSDQDLLSFLQPEKVLGMSDGSEVTGVRKDGSLVPVRRAIGHARLGDEDLYVCFITDISEHRAMMQALNASEQQFRSLIGNIPGISYRCLLSGDYPMLFISDAVERVAGYPAADFLGERPRRMFGTLIYAADRARVSEQIAAALAEDRPYLIEYRLLHADGSVRWLWENGTAVRDEHGAVRWLDGVVLDITERRKIEEALRQAKEQAEQAAAARATFVANMSHEIRTPMNSILGFTDVLLDGELSQEQRRHLDIIRNAGSSLLLLLNDILDTAKLEKGAVELELRDFNLLSLIDELSSTMGANARAKGLFIDIHYDPSLPTSLAGDELRIRQVLTNLLDNAIKFTQSGSVSLRFQPRGDRLYFAVRDTGIGIAPERLAAIFEPFTQADASMTRRFGGTGLGTTISKQLVELMGGEIWADSIPGEGTTFHVLLPLMLARRAQQVPRVRSAAVLPPLSVLAADDVPQNLELLQLLLARRGHTLTTVSDGIAVVEQAARRQYDLILMDFQMPLQDGLAATRAIRALEAACGRRRVPVIAMTASVLPEHRAASAEVGMDGFASKPVDWYALSHEIARVLGIGPGAADAQDDTPAAASEVLNRRAGLYRWGGKEDAYAEALDHFERQHGELGTQLAAHAASDPQVLRVTAHKVRGVAANIGLEQLADALGALERNGVSAGSGAGSAAALEAATAALEQALAAIRAARPAPAPAPSQVAAGVDIARARRAGLVLLEALQRGALDDAALAGMAAALAGHPAAAGVTRVHNALADFDFDLALDQLGALLALLAEADPQESTQ